MIHNRLLEELDRIQRRHRKLHLWRALAVGWFLVAAVGVCMSVLASTGGWVPSWTLPLLAALACLATGVSVFLATRRTPGRLNVARQIEEEYPELDSVLLAALEQEPESPDGRFGFLQENVIRGALAHSRHHDWDETAPERRIRRAQISGSVGLGLLIAIFGWLAGFDHQRPATADRPPIDTRLPSEKEYDVTVTPGDTEIERGTSLIVTARFTADVPDDAVLVYADDSGASTRDPMSLSFSDPMFGGRVVDVQSDLAYRVEYADRQTREFRATVYEYPMLRRSDVRLVFPDYTSLRQKLVEDTRRVTAVEGTELTLICGLNKPVETAWLVEEDGRRLELTPTDDDPAVYSATEILQQSGRYRLHLVDSAGRENKEPPEFVFNVTKNRPPDLKIAQPARDVRVSPIEELSTKASVWDDFGLSAYGITLGLAGRPPREAVLGESAVRNQRHEVEHLIDFESFQAEPDELLSYYFWAEDIGPDGRPRRSLGDMYFAEVRHFEEIFREGEQPPGEPSEEKQEEEKEEETEEQVRKLAELQKQIINATWTVIRRETSAQPSDKFGADVAEIYQSQEGAIGQAAELAEKLRDAQSQQHVGAVIEHMSEAHTRLGEAFRASNPQPLTAALSAQQAAYQALLKLRAREHEVIRRQRQQKPQQQQPSSASGQQSRMQQQLEQLELDDEENRYETQSTSTPEQDQAERETRQVLNRLRELARRQGDLNQRLKELQSALEEAQSEEEKEEIRRRLKRLREQQQEIMRDTDELQQRIEQPENQERMAESSRKLEETRENIRQTTEALQEGQVSKAVASGTRAQRQLEEMREEFRRKAADRFSEEVKQLREDARQLDENEAKLAEQLREFENPKSQPGNLRDPNRDEDLDDDFQRQREDLDRLLENIRETVEEAEETEPLMTERLYDTFRKARQRRIDDALETTRTMLDRGFLDQARQVESQASQGIEELKSGVEEAAEGILGDENEALRRAHQVLEELADELNEELRRSDPSRPGDGRPQQSQDQQQPQQPQDQQGQQPGQPQQPHNQQGQQPGQPGNNPPVDLQQFRDAADPRPGPITGQDFVNWSDRMRDVEEMVDDPAMRAEAARIRETARGIRRQAHGGSEGPNWDIVREFVANPLNELRDRVAEELLRRGTTESMVPIDRDPVPSKYVEQVRRYYEELGKGE